MHLEDLMTLTQNVSHPQRNRYHVRSVHELRTLLQDGAYLL